MGKVVGSIFGKIFGGGKKPRAASPAPALESEKRKAKKSRAALLETSGGAAGEELSPEEVSRRETLLGN